MTLYAVKLLRRHSLSSHCDALYVYCDGSSRDSFAAVRRFRPGPSGPNHLVRSPESACFGSIGSGIGNGLSFLLLFPFETTKFVGRTLSIQTAFCSRISASHTIQPNSYSSTILFMAPPDTAKTSIPTSSEKNPTDQTNAADRRKDADASLTR